jgi:hypothetical protein
MRRSPASICFTAANKNPALPVDGVRGIRLDLCACGAHGPELAGHDYCARCGKKATPEKVDVAIVVDASHEERSSALR